MSKLITESSERRIAYFITPHGFGHAARAAAVMEEICSLDPSVRFEIFTKVPRWFFKVSLSQTFGYHSLLTDIGVVQKTPFNEDIPETLKRLNNFFPFDHSRISNVAKLLIEIECKLIVCDIAPMGIIAAKEAGIPSILIENFTWDWIYQGYVNDVFQLNRYISYLQGLYDAADYRIQTEPVCNYHAADLTTLPISRKVRTHDKKIREELKIPGQGKMVMITMGGTPGQYKFLKQLERHPDIYFVIPIDSSVTQIRNNLIFLPHHSDFYHPDLVNACDALIGKLGYSTVAEVYHAGIPFGYVMRPRFRESTMLAAYIKNQMNGLAIEASEFLNGGWLSHLTDLLALPKIKHSNSNGATQAARFICTLLNNR